ncbi:MAG: competence protein ComFC [Bradyrhizobium sp.]|nr:competence protein ComFC [Bradyrhizobium sp.]
MTIELVGNWMTGRAFDVHTLSSTYLGPDESGYAKWENVRSDMGELIFKLKYRQDKSTLPVIVSLLDKIKGVEQFDYIIPIPPTDKSRPFQPVTEIALALGKHRGVPVLPDFLSKTSGGRQLKNVDDPEEREKLLQESLSIQGKEALSGKRILLLDDLYRSGATLRVATDLLLKEAKAEKVSVLTMTKTRSNR